MRLFGCMKPVDQNAGNSSVPPSQSTPSIIQSTTSSVASGTVSTKSAPRNTFSRQYAAKHAPSSSSSSSTSSVASGVGIVPSSSPVYSRPIPSRLPPSSPPSNLRSPVSHDEKEESTVSAPSSMTSTKMPNVYTTTTGVTFYKIRGLTDEEHTILSTCITSNKPFPLLLEEKFIAGQPAEWSGKGITAKAHVIRGTVYTAAC